MDHRRQGITALICLIIITIIYGHEQTIVPAVPLSQRTLAVAPEIIMHGDQTGRRVVFTFDGGEGNQSAEQILDALAAHHVRGTFFLTGKWMMRNQALSRRIQAAGHEIYNHSFDHPYFTKLDTAEIINEIGHTDNVAESILGSTTRPFFRPPYGDYDEHVVNAVAHEGYRTVLWTIDAGDWMESSGYTAYDVKARIYDSVVPGSIILMHIGDTITGAVLDEVFSKLEDQGYKIVSLSQALSNSVKPDFENKKSLRVAW